MPLTATTDPGPAASGSMLMVAGRPDEATAGTAVVKSATTTIAVRSVEWHRARMTRA